MDHDQITKLAFERGLGTVHFEFRTARNTSRAFEVGYVFVVGSRELFCKRQSFSSPDEFYLCNEFRGLASESPSV